MLSLGPKPLALSPGAEAICQGLWDHGYQAYIVGGAVRDGLRGLIPEDWDITTDATPEQVETVFPRTYPTGKEFGTISVGIGDELLEVTTMRQDGAYSDQRRPDLVIYTKDIKEDLRRRDFTINAIAFEPKTGQYLDPFGGLKDVRRKRLRTVGPAVHRFYEDPLRMLRLLRFMAVLEFKPVKEALDAVKPEEIRTVSRERIRDELTKLLLAPKPTVALETMYQLGVMAEILPEVAVCAGVRQGSLHHWDVLGHSIRTAEAIKPELHLRLAALFHDVGKPLTFAEGSDHPHFYEHDAIGADLTRSRLLELRFSRRIADRVAHLVRWHMFPVHPQSTDRALRRFASKVGRKAVFELLELRRADIMASRFQPRQALDYGQRLGRRLDEVLAPDTALTAEHLAVNGDDIIEKLQIQPGPIVGEILDYLLQQVLEDPQKNIRSTLLDLAHHYFVKHYADNEDKA